MRPIEAADGDRLTRLLARMSPESRRLRFFGPVNRLSARELEHFVNVNHYCREALVAIRNDEIVGVARYDSICGADDAEMAVAIEDDWQRHGLGRQLVRRLACIAAARNYHALTAMILPDNRAALGLVHDIAPGASVRWRDGAYRVIVPLAGVC